MKKSLIKIICLMLIVQLNWMGLSAVLRTLAFFNNIESSKDNLFEATLLDFSLVDGHIEDFIGMEAESDIEFASLVIKITGSLDLQYEVYAEKISGNDDFCNALLLETEHNGIEKHDGALLSLNVPATPQLGTWEFEIDLPVSASNVSHGAECDADLVFKGWRSDILNFAESGFTDEERIELRLTSRMVVLNEFLPNPEGEAYGFDFGDDGDSMPQGEWVELYSNSDISADLSGWYVWDESGDAGNKIYITSANTSPSTTIINGKSWLVVYINKEMFDNTGDTVKLFDNNDKLIDSYSYNDNDYCNVEPTPEDPNSTSGSGSCPGVPPNKSYGRIPDGIGYWFDPIPTPGGPNTLIFEQNNFDNIVEAENDKKEIVTETPEETPTIEEGDTDTEELFTTEEPEEPISNPPDISVVETTTPPEDGIVDGEETSVEEEPVAEEEPVSEGEPAIEEEPAGEEVITEENQEEGGIIEEINEIIDEVIDEIVDEIMPDETTNEPAEEVLDEVIITDETILEPEAPIIEEPAVEDLVIEEAPVVDEQPVVVPDGTGESVSDEGSGDGGNDTSGSLDGSSPAEGTGESFGDSGIDAGGESVSE